MSALASYCLYLLVRCFGFPVFFSALSLETVLVLPGLEEWTQFQAQVPFSFSMLHPAGRMGSGS